MLQPRVYYSSRFIPRAIYDISNFLILAVIMIAIITGMIIDAFGASRDHRHEVDENQAGMCFICGIESSQFDRAKGFRIHYKEEHNMWNYLYFLAYLKEKDENEYTGKHFFQIIL